MAFKMKGFSPYTKVTNTDDGKNIPEPRIVQGDEAKDPNHPKHRQWVEENLIKYGPGSTKPYVSWEDYLSKTQTKKKSPMTKMMDPPEQQEKIIKMIQTGIQKNKSDKEIMKKVNKMSDGKNTYEWNTKTGEVQVKGEHPRHGKDTKNQGDYEPAYEGGD